MSLSWYGLFSLVSFPELPHQHQHRHSHTQQLNVAYLQVHFTDGKTTLKVPPNMSMGELLFYAAEKRKVNPTDFELYEDGKSKKPAKLTGSIGANAYKELYLVGRKNLKPLISGPSQTDISTPLRKQPSIGDTDMHVIASLLSQGVSCVDARIPEPWRRLFDRARIVQTVDHDVSERDVLLHIIERHGGPSILLAKSDAELEQLFPPSSAMRHSKSMSAARAVTATPDSGPNQVNSKESSPGHD